MISVAPGSIRIGLDVGGTKIAGVALGPDGAQLGGLTALGEPLLCGIRRVLRESAEESPFLRSLRLDERIEMLPAASPVAAIGAALLDAAPAAVHDLEKEISAHG